MGFGSGALGEPQMTQMDTDGQLDHGRKLTSFLGFQFMRPDRHIEMLVQQHLKAI